MGNKILPPIPKDPIKESFVWRDWFQRLSDRVFGTASTADLPISIANGGTGQTTANSGLNALLPTQAGSAGKVLGTDGSNTSWVTGGGGPSSQGPAGPAVFLEAPEADEPFVFPGRDGAVGNTGPTGATGPQGPIGFGMDGDDGLDGFPGVQGPTGAPATPGNAAYGEMNIIANASGTVLTLQNTFYQITTNWVAGNNNGFTFGSSSLTAKYPGAYLTSVSLSMSTTSSNQIYEVRIYKNGVAIAGHVAELKLVNSTDVNSLAFSAVIDNVQTNDVFTLWLQNESSAGQTATISYANMSITAIQGATGNTGPQGMPGLDGEQGEDGPHGPPGNPGATGATGSTGSQGPQGPATYLEAEVVEPDMFVVPGPVGPSGSAGSVGPSGPVGPAVYLEVEPADPDMFVVPGPAGSVGPTGNTGAQGPVGPPIYLDAEGPDGDMGPPGPPGAVGASGATGAQGPVGPAVFLEAEPGEDGAMGPPGVAGAAGVAGSTGAQGPVGPVFLVADGEDGNDGAPGVPGQVGASGTAGVQGPAGPAVYLEADVIEPDFFVVPGPQGAAGAGSTNKGVATVNFGAFPGASDASVTVTGQTTIASNSAVIANVTPLVTADHSADEHWVETLQIAAGNIVAGTGFTIYAKNINTLFEPGSLNAKGTRIYGQWSVAWQWS